MDITQIAGEVAAFFQSDGVAIATTFCTILRIVAPLLALLILWRCARPLLTFQPEPETWAWLVMPDGNQLPITHWESIIGRSKGSDIVVDFPTVSRAHAVLTRYDDGSWSLSDIGARGAVSVNGEQIAVAAIEYGDVVSLGGVEMKLVPVTQEEVEEQTYSRTSPKHQSSPGLTLLLLTIFQVLAACQLWMQVAPEYAQTVLVSFLSLIALQWVLLLTLRLLHRSGYEVETLAFFLCTIGFSVIASDSPGSLYKQLFTLIAGIFVYLIISFSMRNLSRAKKFRYVAAVCGLGLLAVNLAFGKEIYGAKNWIMIGSMSFQPSELVKLCFIYVGASTLDRVVTKRNLITFIIYSAAICGCLALMNDFGAALIFFVTFLVIAFLRSGSFATVSLACAATGLAGVMAVRFSPHVLSRFSTWGHAWEYALSGGYQQTRAMMCIASGGLLGLGAGKGWLKHVAASDTDLVFAFVGEEWGLIIALAMVAAIIIFAFFVVRSSKAGRSSFYTIAACAAVAVLLMQTILNVFGTMDLLPLTGVTFPFVSNGGSSMMCSWGLIAFIKAADTRQNASFAVKAARVEEAPLYE